MKIYVGNLPWRFNDQELNDLFARIGQVQSARVITDKETGRSRGFGFVEMSQADGERAVAELNGTQVQNRMLRINEANERPPRAGGSGPRPAGGYGSGGYRGGDRSGDRGDRDQGSGNRH